MRDPVRVGVRDPVSVRVRVRVSMYGAAGGRPAKQTVHEVP